MSGVLHKPRSPIFTSAKEVMFLSAFVCLFVGKKTPKVLNGFLLNVQEMLITRDKEQLILVTFWITIWLQDFFEGFLLGGGLSSPSAFLVSSVMTVCYKRNVYHHIEAPFTEQLGGS